MDMEDLHEVAALDFVFAKDDRLLSSSASCAIHMARSSSSKASSSSVSSVIVGRWSRGEHGVFNEALQSIMVARLYRLRPDRGVLGDFKSGFDGVAGGRAQAAAVVGKLQEEVAKYAGSRLFAIEYGVGVLIPGVCSKR